MPIDPNAEIEITAFDWVPDFARGLVRDLRPRWACEELGVAYVSEREQFGKKIGTYQAVSHPLSDTYVETELARSLAYWAAWCVAADDEQAPTAVAAAKSFCAETAVAACERSIQVHGGIGFTWEHVLHRYYKRAQWIDAFGGHAAVQRRVVAAALLD